MKILTEWNCTFSILLLNEMDSKKKKENAVKWLGWEGRKNRKGKRYCVNLYVHSYVLCVAVCVLESRSEERSDEGCTVSGPWITPLARCMRLIHHELQFLFSYALCYAVTWNYSSNVIYLRHKWEECWFCLVKSFWAVNKKLYSL